MLMSGRQQAHNEHADTFMLYLSGIVYTTPVCWYGNSVQNKAEDDDNIKYYVFKYTVIKELNIMPILFCMILVLHTLF